VKLGRGVILSDFVNLYGCSIGNRTKIGAFVEIQKGATIGADCKISSHTFVCEGVTIEDRVFVGHNVSFINDKHPRAATPGGRLKADGDWTCVPTRVCAGASVGTGATILCGVTVGRGAFIGAGSVVTRDVKAGTTVAGNPAGLVRAAPKGGRGSRIK
jgi:acetyltransferase-like isoleucine patch superfamily enzyme